MDSLSPLQTGDRAKRAWQEAGGGGKGSAERGRGSRFGSGQRCVTWSSPPPQGWGCSSGLEAQRRGPKPGSASAAWPLLAAWGRLLSGLPVQVSQPGLRRLGAAGKGGQPARTPGFSAKGTRGRESSRGAGSAVPSKWGAEEHGVPRGPLLCVRFIGVTREGVRGWRWERSPGRGQGNQVTAVQVQILDPGV